MKNCLSIFGAAALVAAIVVALPGPVHAQNSGGSAPGSQTPSQASVQAQQAQDPDTLFEILKSLRDQVAELTAEVRDLRKTSERTETRMELLLTQERADRIDDNIATLKQRQVDLANNERALQARQDNIEQELTNRAEINRDDARDAILSQISKDFDNVHAQQSANSKHLEQLQSESARLHARIEELRKQLQTLDRPSGRP